MLLALVEEAMGQVIIYMLGLSASRVYIKVDILGYLRGNISQRKGKKNDIFTQNINVCLYPLQKGKCYTIKQQCCDTIATRYVHHKNPMR